MLTYILLCLAGLIAALLILAAFGKDDFTITQETTINKASSDVYNYVKLLKNSEHFNKWVMTDPNMKKDFKGTDGTVGFVYSWDSENSQVGKGSQEITKLTEGQRIDYEIRFIKPFAGTSFAWIIIESIGSNQTKVTWAFKGIKNYMMKVMHLVLNLEKVLAKDLQTSLQNLKNIMEKNN